MTLSASKLLTTFTTTAMSWTPDLDSASSTALTVKGAIRWDFHSKFGYRRFIYGRCDQSGGCTKGQLQSFRTPISIANISEGTTTTITTSGLTADILIDGLLYCIDDAGAAGAAPEGESGVITANSATVVTIDSDDAFSASPAANDDFNVLLPWAVVDSASSDAAGTVAGVAMADLAQYQYGWFQFDGIHPSVDVVAAGTALPVGESLIAGTALLTDGAGAAVDLRVGKLLLPVASDQVLRKAVVRLCCGPAFTMGVSTS